MKRVNADTDMALLASLAADLQRYGGRLARFARERRMDINPPDYLTEPQQTYLRSFLKDINSTVAALNRRYTDS